MRFLGEEDVRTTKAYADHGDKIMAVRVGDEWRVICETWLDMFDSRLKELKKEIEGGDRRGKHKYPKMYYVYRRERRRNSVRLHDRRKCRYA